MRREEDWWINVPGLEPISFIGTATEADQECRKYSERYQVSVTKERIVEENDYE